MEKGSDFKSTITDFTGRMTDLQKQSEAAAKMLGNIQKLADVLEKKQVDGTGVSLLNGRVLLEFESHEHAVAFYKQFTK